MTIRSALAPLVLRDIPRAVIGADHPRRHRDQLRQHRRPLRLPGAAAVGGGGAGVPGDLGRPASAPRPSPTTTAISTWTCSGPLVSAESSRRAGSPEARGAGRLLRIHAHQCLDHRRRHGAQRAGEHHRRHTDDRSLSGVRASASRFMRWRRLPGRSSATLRVPLRERPSPGTEGDAHAVADAGPAACAAGSRLSLLYRAAGDRHLAIVAVHAGAADRGAADHVRQHRQFRAAGGAVLHLCRRTDGPRRHGAAAGCRGDCPVRRHSRRRADHDRRRRRAVRLHFRVDRGNGCRPRTAVLSAAAQDRLRREILDRRHHLRRLSRQHHSSLDRDDPVLRGRRAVGDQAVCRRRDPGHRAGGDHGGLHLLLCAVEAARRRDAVSMARVRGWR